jgi:hypothetical protein
MSDEREALTHYSLLITHHSSLFLCQPSCRQAASIENSQQRARAAGGMRSWIDEF